SNERTDFPLPAESGQPTPGSTPAPVGPDLRAEVPTEASGSRPSPSAPPPPRPMGARRAGLVDWSSAPSDDPIIAAELARCAAARQAAAPALTMAEVLAAVLSPPAPSQDATVASVDVPAGPDGPPLPGGIPGAAPVPLDDAEV